MLLVALGLFAFFIGLPAGPRDIVRSCEPEGCEPLRGLVDAYRVPPRDWPSPVLDAGVEFIELGALSLPGHAAGREAEKVRLGAALFHDPLLSATGELSCAGCHHPDHGWTEAQPSRAGRNVPSLFSVTHRSLWSWDGRRHDLREQLLAPLTEPEEMANTGLDEVVERVRGSVPYGPRFRAVYGDQPLTSDMLADALLSFVAQVDEPSRFERFAGGEHNALQDQEIWGLHLFRTKAGCANCHYGPLLSDDRFHNLGLSSFGEPAEDLGRYRVTGKAEDVGRFRTPSLRHVSRTAPYMHSGHFGSLEGVIRFYARGGGEVWARNETEASRPLYSFAAKLSPHLRPLDLDEAERRALLAFLKAI